MNCVLSSLPILRLPGFLYKVFFLPYSFNLLLFNYSSMIYHPLDKVLRFYILESDVLFIFGCASHLFKHPLNRYLASQLKEILNFSHFQVWWADSPLQETHRCKALQMQSLWEKFREVWPPCAPHEETHAKTSEKLTPPQQYFCPL